MQFKSKKQYFFMQRQCEDLIRQVCPEISNRSGIYFYTRDDEEGKSFYIGKAKDLLKRCCSHHLGRKQHIDCSIHNRGYYDPVNNEMGWKLNVLYFPESELDEKEQYYIDQYTKAGYITYNIESGGTVGKELIGERKPAKGYYDGLSQSRKKVKSEIRVFFDKYLDYVIKGKPNKIKERKFKEFTDYLYKEENQETEDTENEI